MTPTGSGLERAAACPASCALPRARSTTEASTQGTANHEEIETVLASGGDLSTLPLAVQRVVTGAVSVDVEVAYALDVERERVRVIGRRIGRAYGTLAPSEIALTIDAVVMFDQGVTVADWKSRKRVTPAVRNLQIRAGVVAVMKTHAVGEVTGALGYLDDGEVDSHPFDAFDAANFWDEMRGVLARVRRAEAAVAEGKHVEVHTGPWCEYCPAIAYCPAHTRLALAMLGELDDVEKQIAFMTPEQCGRAWDLLKQAKAIVDRVDVSLRTRAKQDVIPLAGGKRLAMVEGTRRSVDSKAAVARIVELGGKTDDLYKVAHYTQVREVAVKESV